MKSTIFILATCAGLITSCNTKNQEPMETTTHHEAHVKDYACPMHPEVKGYDGETCPKCGMKQEKVSSQSNVSMLFSAEKKVEAGKPIQLTFKPVNNSDSTKAVTLEEAHERLIHVIAVSEDLSWFDHIHAEPNGAESFAVQETFPAGGHYFVYADYKPKDDDPRTEKFEVHVSGEPRKSVEHKSSLTAAVDGYQLSIMNNAIRTGTIELPITIEKDGKKLQRRDIENYLGAVAHIILIHKEEKDFLHIHPESTEEFPIVAHTDISKPGMYRMWVQFQTNGTLHTAAFTLDVKESKDDAQKTPHAHKH